VLSRSAARRTSRPCTAPGTLAQVDVVAEQEVLAAGAQRVAEHLGDVLQIFEAQQEAREERQVRLAEGRDGHHLIAGQLGRARFVGELGRETQREFAAESDPPEGIREPLQHGVEQTAFGFEPRERGVVERGAGERFGHDENPRCRRQR
jgi:hypothetical protein